MFEKEKRCLESKTRFCNLPKYMIVGKGNTGMCQEKCRTFSCTGWTLSRPEEVERSREQGGGSEDKAGVIQVKLEQCISPLALRRYKNLKQCLCVRIRMIDGYKCLSFKDRAASSFLKGLIPNYQQVQYPSLGNRKQVYGLAEVGSQLGGMTSKHQGYVWPQSSLLDLLDDV